MRPRPGTLPLGRRDRRARRPCRGPGLSFPSVPCSEDPVTEKAVFRLPLLRAPLAAPSTGLELAAVGARPWVLAGPERPPPPLHCRAPRAPQLLAERTSNSQTARAASGWPSPPGFCPRPLPGAPLSRAPPGRHCHHSPCYRLRISASLFQRLRETRVTHRRLSRRCHRGFGRPCGAEAPRAVRRRACWAGRSGLLAG